MKKVFLSIALLLSIVVCFSQPVTPRSSSAVTVLDSRWMGQYNMFVPRYADTSSANTQKGVDSLGAQIFTYDIQAMWIRCMNTTGSKYWLQLLPSGGGGGQRAWVIGGQGGFFTSPTDPQIIGVTTNQPFALMSNNITRVILPAAGITRQSGGANKYMLYDTTGKTWGYGDAASVSNEWHITGNSGTTAGTNFLGTTDGANLMFKVGGVQSGFIDADNDNTSLGYQTLFSNTSGNGNSAFGAATMTGNTTGTGNSAFGVNALAVNTIGINNAAHGNSALIAVTGSYNTGAGASAGQTNTTGSHNTYVGDSTGLGVTTGSGNAFFGDRLTGYSSGLNGYLALGANATERIGVNSAGAVQFSIGGYGTANYLLQSAGSGAPPTWVNPSSIVTATPTWQQTLSVAGGSILDQENDIDAQNNQIFINNTLGFGINTSTTTNEYSSLAIAQQLTEIVTRNEDSVSSIYNSIPLGSGKPYAKITAFQNNNVLHTSIIDVYMDSIGIKPYNGELYIDTLNNENSQNKVMGWTSTTGADRGGVGYLNLGSGLSITSGTLNASGGWGTTDTVATLTGASTLKMATNTFNFSGGMVGIGTTPLVSLDVNGRINVVATGVGNNDIISDFDTNLGQVGADTYITISGNQNADNITYNASSGHIFNGAVSTNNTLIVGSVTTLTDLSGTGTRAVLADASGVLSAPISDRTTKQNIQTLTYGLSTLNKFKPVSFEYREGFKNFGAGTQIGFIAQDVQKILPNSTYTNNSNGKMGYNEVDIIPILVKSVQELSAKVDALEKQNKSLSKQLSAKGNPKKIIIKYHR